MDWRSFEKTFNVKLPIFEHVYYYLETLKKSPEFEKIDSFIEMFKRYESSMNGQSIKQNKIDWIEKTKQHLQEIGFIDDLNAWKTPDDFQFKSKGFNPQDGSTYMSIDINEANWTVSKHFLGYDLPKWEEFTLNLGYPEALAKSKSFRQFVLGNTNPKRYARMQQVLTVQHIDMLKQHATEHDIEFVSEDEIIISIIIRVTTPQDIERIMNLPWQVPVKKVLFTTDYHENLGDRVRVDTIKDVENGVIVDKYKRLKEVPGNRFFMHFKTLVLDEELDERDLLFKNDKHIAKWVI
jgi:hypothetical protein